MTISAIQKESGEAQPLGFSSSAGTFSFNSAVGCGFLDCFFQFNPLTQSGTEVITNDTPMMTWYHLTSDINRNTAHFEFDYKWKSICECGCLELKAKKGLWKQLTSLDYPDHYCNLMKCKYLITAPQGCIVDANITELALEPNEDVLAIFDGTNITDRRIKITSGVEIFTDLLRSTAETMTVYFETDSSITNKGFVLYYTAGPFLFILERQHFQVQIERSEEKFNLLQTAVMFRRPKKSLERHFRSWFYQLVS
uniref:CUB domain-containing protein n=1 Tax=Wuchereria bancrofti TaxID=6293 RepID=A0A1I8ECM9_WUCBA